MSNNSGPPYFGQCLCGAIKYQVDAIEPKMGHCHCSMCRKFHGAAFATYGEAKRENFHWLKGETLLCAYKADNATVRQFCRNCGSSLTFAAADGEQEIVEFALSTLDSDIEQSPDVHIFTAYKANWYEITDDLPRFKDDRESDPAD